MFATLQVPVALAACALGVNHMSPEPLTSGDLAAVLAGFLSHKLAHIAYVYQHVKQPVSTDSETRPRFDFSQYEEFQYDQYGRPRVKPQAVQEADDALAAEQARAAAWVAADGHAGKGPADA